MGPRPALWSQFDLVAERDLYGANNVRPGLTGWAQINGRDELSIKSKAMRDGEYVAKLGIGFDLRCFFGTFAKLFTGSGVVESTVPEPEKEEAKQVSVVTAQFFETENVAFPTSDSSQSQQQESEKGAIA